MRAAVWHGLKDIRVEKKDIPKVSSNQVKVKVAWAGICGSDLHEYTTGPVTLPADSPDPLTGVQAPLTMGHEFAGVVEEVGSDVSQVKAGDRVAINPLIISGNHENPLVDMYKGFR